MSDHLIWLIGAGPMARFYVPVLRDLGLRFEIIGRGDKSAAALEAKCEVPVHRGGLEKFLASKPEMASTALVVTNLAELGPTTLQILRAGVRRVLIEKPGATTAAELEAIQSAAGNCVVRIGYNRRCLSSVALARRMIEEDGGVSSFSFEFTEWAHVIEKLDHSAAIKANWFFNNSTHPVDLAFFLGGEPAELHGMVHGSLPWHPRAAAFSGCGRTHAGALFSYHADWRAPGSWGVVINTPRRRLILKPLEKLSVQELGSIEVKPQALEGEDDVRFKPGLREQVRLFLEAPNDPRLMTVEAQLKRLREVYSRMLGERA